MANYTTDTYAMKREILTFSNNLTKGLHIPKRKFIADMSYGMLASNKLPSLRYSGYPPRGSEKEEHYRTPLA